MQLEIPPERKTPATKGIHGFENLLIMLRRMRLVQWRLKKTPRKRTTVKSDIKLWHIKTLKCLVSIGHECGGYY